MKRGEVWTVTGGDDYAGNPLRSSCIPAGLAYKRSDLEVEIERVGDEIRIRPARRSLAGVLEKFEKFSPDFMAEGRDAYEQAERDER
ncbi:antitoxin VapB [Rhodoblastus acidophilus]|uniref:AbrB family transcriptional regulator n=1 Tax=Rhodoblastus acidophilus TaxID=1074 RepID=UPI002224AD1F|nr:AbrB family transcriptional regulator [Rhodoblastus acidophilus]MCW2284798.1 antitoxin VapB [Rhodoblastus acidophilus]MCW2333751.1 antitoxin VapB [Rhodoblastus acidophilus]